MHVVHVVKPNQNNFPSFFDEKSASCLCAYASPAAKRSKNIKQCSSCILQSD
jgi:hypothetical protein